MPANKEKEILDFLSELLSLEQLDEILKQVVQQAPKIIDCMACSIYLVPELLNQKPEELIDGNLNRLYYYSIDYPFVVLAATSSSKEQEKFVGRYFYRSGEGLTGSVFKTEAPVFLDDLSDIEIGLHYPGAKWKNKYGHATTVYTKEYNGRLKPFIALPLVSNARCVGVIKFLGSRATRPFSKLAKETVNSFGNLISRRIETELSKQSQECSIRNLISIGAMSNEKGVFKSIVQEAQKTVGATICRLYIMDETGNEITLEEDTNQSGHRQLKTKFKRGEGYIGWIFKTGFPLKINKIVTQIEIDFYNSENYLGSRDYFNQGNEKAKTIHIELADHELCGKDDSFKRFLGVPLSKEKNRIHGVLVALSESESKKFNDDDLFLFQKLAQTVTQLLESFQQQKLNEMLIHMGHEYGDKLFQYVVDHLPALVIAQGCSIFKRINSSNNFTLKYTSSKWFKDDSGRVKKISYAPGVGKTGFVAKYGRILVINYYSLGEEDSEGITHEKLESDFSKYRGPIFENTNYIRKVTDGRGIPQGLARIIRDKKDPPFSDEEKKAFDDFIDQNPYTSKEGLECHYEEKTCEDGEDGGYSTSFLAVPFKDRQGNVYGVMRIPKSIPGGYFTEQDLNLVISVCNRLFSYIELEQNLLTITGINTQINASFGVGSLDNILTSILSAVTDSLGFEFVNIQLVSPDKKFIKYRLGRANPKISGAMDPDDWSKHVNFSLDSDKPDIHVWLLREHKKPYVVTEWDDHFSKEIYEKYNHKDLIRVYIPIIIQNTDDIIGTLEAGHHIKRRNYIDPEEIYMLKALADSAAIAIKNAQLHNMLGSKIEESTKAYREFATFSQEFRAPLTPIINYMQETLDGAYGPINNELTLATQKNLHYLDNYIRMIRSIIERKESQK
jgi:GAF domain-containing protein